MSQSISLSFSFCVGSQLDPAILSAFLEFLYTDAVLGIDESICSDLLKLAQKVNTKDNTLKITVTHYFLFFSEV
jgi:hypothetical protein